MSRIEIGIRALLASTPLQEVIIQLIKITNILIRQVEEYLLMAIAHIKKVYVTLIYHIPYS